ARQRRGQVRRDVAAALADEFGAHRAFEIGELLFQIGDALLSLRESLVLPLHFVWRYNRTIAEADAVEHGLDAVVIALRNGVELVIVAAGAVERQAEER